MTTHKDASRFAGLIERLEKATGPDRELDFEIHCVRGFSAGRYRARDSQGSWIEYSAHDESGKQIPLPHYTGSIDAAMTALPEGFEPHQLAFPQGSGRTFGFELFPPYGYACWNGSIIGRGKTAATAIVIAVLKARSAIASGQKPDGEERG